MTVLTACLLVLAGTAGEITLPGRVTDPAGQPVPGARVFLEQGLGGDLREGEVSTSGEFTFPDVLPGPVGVLAWAPGHAFGGQHFNLATNDTVPPLTLLLSTPVTLKGHVVNHQGLPVEGARVTRVALLGDAPVGIPLAKLRVLGFDEPVSAGDGRFSIEHLPAGAMVALKVGHPEYAQEGLTGVPASAEEVRVELTTGILVEGGVRTREHGMPVSQATLIFRNAQPPHDTAVTMTDARGQFLLRMKPGVYLCKAEGRGYRSPGWTNLVVSGETPGQKFDLQMAGRATISGSVKDAVTGKPIAGVRMVLESQGNVAAIERTGPTGEFRFDAAAGENTVRMQPPPGYLPPADTRWSTMLSENQEFALPGLWLAPMPQLTLSVVDAGEESVPGALVSVLRPYQFVWQVAGAGGKLSLDIARFPEGGKVIAMAEHPSAPQGALFALTPENASGALVKLFPHARVTGIVTDAGGAPLAGVLVGAIFPGERPEEELLLWRCVSDGQGRFSWDAVVPGVPQRCIAIDGAGRAGESRIFNAAPETLEDLGNVVVVNGQPGTSSLGQPLPWWDMPVVCGPTGSEKRGPAIVVKTTPAEAEIVFNGLARLPGVPGFGGLLPVAIGAPGVNCGEGSGVYVRRGDAPGAATTYVLDGAGTVILETAGLPPASALRGL
jgi:hypothetical protein